MATTGRSLGVTLTYQGKLDEAIACFQSRIEDIFVNLDELLKIVKLAGLG